MSKPKYWWYGFIKTAITRSGAGDHSLQSFIISKAIDEANRETLTLPQGTERMKAVELVLFNDKSYVSAGIELNYCEETVKRWVNSYVNLVGRKAGY